MNRVMLFCFLSPFFFLSALQSQQHIAFDHLTVEDGLSQSSVTCIFQDSKGFMWFGTQDGLNRYDGYKFRIFKNDPTDSTTLTDNFIFSISEHPSGKLYIETQSGTLHLYKPKSESFEIVDKDSTNLTECRVSTVGAVLRESSGVTWTGGLGRGTGLKRTDTKTGETTVFKNDPADPSSLSDDKVYSVFRDRSGNLWVGTYNGLDRLDEGTGKFFHYRNDPDDPNSLPDNWVWPIYEDSHGYLWVGTVQAGLCRFDPKTERFTIYKNDPNDPTSLSNNFIFSIYEDRGSVMWVGTNLGGINYFHRSTNTFEHYKNDPGNRNSLSDNLVTSMLVDKNGIYWIGTSKGGLNRFDYKRKMFTSYKSDPENANSLNSNSIQSLLEDRSGILWIGTFSSGLNAFDRKTGTFTHYTHDPSTPNSLTDNRIYALAEDKDENIWIGTYGGGLNKLNKKTGEIAHYQHSEEDSASISSDATWAIAQDTSDKLWIGTFGGGVNVLNEEHQAFRHFMNKPDDAVSIVDNNIIRVFKDSKGNMWFGTTKGLSRYSWDSDNFRNYNERDGLANSFVYGIVEDDHGNLWLSTNDGLSRFNPEQETFKNYYAKDGLQGNEFNQNAFAKDGKTGNLLFGGPNGFNVFNPDSLKDNLYRPPVVFTDFLRYNTDDEEGRPIVEKGISERDTVSLTYKDNIINFEFAALSFYNNHENQYRYMLEGFNENWIQLGNNHSVTFTNLSPGDYYLRVIGSNNDGVWNEEGAGLVILVSPPWWKSNIAYVIYFVAFFALLFGLRQVEINRREQQAFIRETALLIKATEAENRALEIENERKTKELEAARQLQLSMLPNKLPDLPHLQIGVFMKTATEVGGDYYDFKLHDDGTLTAVIGDATGHGMQAGTMVSATKSLFNALADEQDPVLLLRKGTKAIKAMGLKKMFMALTIARFKDHQMQVAAAGMPFTLLYRSSTGRVEELALKGMPLGGANDFPYPDKKLLLSEGDTVLFTTDGFEEMFNPQNEMLGDEQVKVLFEKSAVHSPEEIIEHLKKAGEAWANGRAQEDDVTFVVIKCVS